jgi:predicted histidine transporter YuiF (NhaC family)
MIIATTVTPNATTGTSQIIAAIAISRKKLIVDLLYDVLTEYDRSQSHHIEKQQNERTDNDSPRH